MERWREIEEKTEANLTGLISGKTAIVFKEKITKNHQKSEVSASWCANLLCWRCLGLVVF